MPALAWPGFSSWPATMLGSWPGASPWPSMRTAPALFLGGQSNSGNVDTVPGTIDSRVTFTWTPDGVAFTGPGPMTVQNANSQNGHSYEWQCAATLAAAYGTNILVGKTWADGTTSDQHVRADGAAAWPRLRNAIDRFARQCVAVGLTRVAFIWDQGSSEALTANAALTPNLQANTAAIFASIRALFRAYGIGRVRFYVMQQNINFIGQLDINTAQLNSVRSQEAALVSGDGDAYLFNCDDIVMASGYHYASGQTNTIGARFAAQIAADFTTAQPAFVTPPTLAGILGASILCRHVSSAGVGVATGQPVSAWADQSGNGFTATAAGAARPLYLANASGAIPGVQWDGVANQSAIQTMSLPVPGTTPTWTWEITRLDTWSNGGRLWSGGAGAGPGCLIMFNGTNNVQIYNGSFGGTAATTPGQFNRIETYFANSTAAHVESASGVTTGDYVKALQAAAGASAGNAALGGIVLGTGAGSFGATTTLERVFCNALPNKTQFDQLCGYYTATYGPGCGYT